MKTTVRLAIVAVLTVAFLAMMSACNGTPDPQPQSPPTTTVEDQVRQNVPNMANFSDTSVDNFMQAVCTDFDNGGTYETTMYDAMSALNITVAQADYLIGTSVQADCPEYMDEGNA